jgi:hypothetical protein
VVEPAEITGDLPWSEAVAGIIPETFLEVRAAHFVIGSRRQVLTANPHGTRGSS